MEKSDKEITIESVEKTGQSFLKATLTKIENLDHSFLLGDLKLDDIDKLFRYVPAEQLLKDIDARQLVFVSPELWEDPYEHRFLTADFQTKYHYTHPDFVCLCFTNDGVDTAAASWRMYSTKNRDALLRVKYRTMDLISQLDAYCGAHGLRLIISRVAYDWPRKELNDDPVGNTLGDGIQNFGDEHFFSLLSVKRKAFTFESEIRFFIVGNDIKIDSDNLLRISMDLRSVIKEAMIEPVDPKYLTLQERREYQLLKSKKDHEYCNKFLPKGIKVKGSTLYTDIPTNELIR